MHSKNAIQIRLNIDPIDDVMCNKHLPCHCQKTGTKKYQNTFFSVSIKQVCLGWLPFVCSVVIACKPQPSSLPALQPFTSRYGSKVGPPQCSMLTVLTTLQGCPDPRALGPALRWLQGKHGLAPAGPTLQYTPTLPTTTSDLQQSPQDLAPSQKSTSSATT